MKKNIANIIVFSVIIFGLMFFFLIKDKEEIIASERRKATPMPPISQIFSEEYSQNFDKFMLDAFPFRETFRKINAHLRLDVLKQKDNSGIYTVDGHLAKIEKNLDEKSVLYAAKKINTLSENRENVYYSIIPDKNYFLADKGGYPHPDYEKMISLMKENVIGAEYIDIFDTLTIDDYYKTDTHWRQEKIVPTAKKILSAMGNDIADTEYKEVSIDNFSGVYAQQSAISTAPETLNYLTSDLTESATVTSAEEKGTFKVYQTEKFDGNDSYDVYLGGAKAVLYVERPLKEGEDKKSLVLFRDSFGSSIAPLFLENYSDITIVDLRYVSSSVLQKFVDLEDKDILFLYNTSILNNAMLLR